MRRSVMLLVCMLFMVVLAAIPAYATTYSVRLNPSSPGIGESITCILNVDGYDVTNSQDKIWFYYQWVKNGNPQNSYSGYGTDALPSGVTSNGDYWQCKILFDGTVQGQSPNTLIGEAPYEPPSGPKTARIEPSTPYQGDGLTCILKINGYDINDPQDKIWFYYQWLKNGAVQSSYSGYGSDLIPSGITNTGQTWVCKILFDGAVQAQSSSVTIQPPQHNPTISLSISPANPGLSQDITCTASVSDTDGNLQNVVFRWYKNSVYITGSEKTKTVNGASASSSDTLSSSNTGYGDVIKCEATVHDTTGRTATANKQVTVESAPENTPPTLSGIPDKSVQVGQTISQIDLYNYAGDAQDPDEQLTYTIDYESNTGVIDCYITGGHYVACGNGLSAGYSDITVRVTDTGGLYETDTFRITVTSAPVEHDPEIYSMTLTPLNPGTNNDLTCTVGVYDGDSNLQKVVFRWYKNGAHITGSEETKTVSGSDATVYDTLPSSNTYYSDVIKCEATVHDFTGRTDTDYMQVTVEPSNQPPVADAGPDQTKTDTDNNGYESFTLDGTGSYD
ncbi:MAG: hypothetical protein JW716_03460, partial [Candidatus Aenigmarchaeota archaeon]|nr:hypothetical protein [Candidatus Aenigmarchaeota archaeon]